MKECKYCHKKYKQLNKHLRWCTAKPNSQKSESPTKDGKYQKVLEILMLLEDYDLLQFEKERKELSKRLRVLVNWVEAFKPEVIV